MPCKSNKNVLTFNDSFLYCWGFAMRCLICSVNKLFGECLCFGLSSVQGVSFVKHVSTIEDAIHTARSKNITSILVDISGDADAAIVPRLARDLPGVCILALSVDDKQATQVVNCARLGCHGIIPRNTAIEGVVRIVEAAERGEVAVRADVAAEMMRALAQSTSIPATDELIECLTRREKEVCTLVCDGLTNKEIAREVNRSVGTIKNHVRAILTKLDLPRRGAINAYLGHTAQTRNIVASKSGVGYVS